MALVKLREPFSSLWQGQDAFEQARLIEGEVYRAREGRITKKCQVGDENFYIKFHSGIGWKEIFKNFLQFKMPVTGARNEWLAIQKLQALGIHSFELVGYGEKEGRAASYDSFIITRELLGAASLEDFCKDWASNPPELHIKMRLIKEVADITRIMHAAGMNHRDLYICHFMLNNAADFSAGVADPELYLMDLHRAQIRQKVPLRWIIKDLSALYFSVMDAGFTQRDIYRFLQIYFNQPVRQCLRQHSTLLRLAERKALRLYAKDSHE